MFDDPQCVQSSGERGRLVHSVASRSELESFARHTGTMCYFDSMHLTQTASELRIPGAIHLQFSVFIGPTLYIAFQ